jgi:hypothetical protein
MEERVILPPKYYHTNFEYLLSFVKDKYHDLLLPNEWQFLRKYYTLSEDEQCLFIRFCNRKGLFFKTEGIHYDELIKIDILLDKLINKEFIVKLDAEKHLNNVGEILGVLTKVDLINIFELKSLKTEKREVIISYLLNETDGYEIINKIASTQKIVKLNFELEVSFLKFLFFGNRYMDMTEFVVRDMGFVQYYKQNDDNLVARFESRKEADDKWMISDQFLVFETLKTIQSDAEILNWFLTLNQAIDNLSEIAVPSLEKLKLRIGKFFEKQKNYESAIVVFETSNIAPARERLARNLVKIGSINEAKAVCSEMLILPQSADEQYFAEYFLQTLELKKTKNKKKTTEWLNESEEISVSTIYKYQVETGAINYYLENGFAAGFSENFTWRTLFGLWLWDIIFDPNLVAFHHPFQRRPSDFYLPDFYIKRKTQINNELDKFDDINDLLVFLREKFVLHYNTANPFVIWVEEIWEMVTVLVVKIELEKLKLIMIKIAENIVENSRGLPDLLVWSDNHYELVEIKSPSDNLSNQQLFWLKYFKEINVNAKVLRVSFEH